MTHRPISKSFSGKEGTLNTNTYLTWKRLVVLLVHFHKHASLILAVFLAGCIKEKSISPKESLSVSNARRASLGLRQIKFPAKFYWSDGYIEKWSAYHGYCKFVYYHNDMKQPFLESDIYHTGRKFVNPDGKMTEEVFVTYYDYTLRRYYINYGGFDKTFSSAVKGHEYTYVHGMSPSGINLSQGSCEYEAFTNVVDTLLEKFGLNRLEYQPPGTSCVISTSVRW